MCMQLYFQLLYGIGIGYVVDVTKPKDTGNPCHPSPCGPNSKCVDIRGSPACSCLPDYLGRPPNCRPECTINAECASNLACINEKCRDPCPGSCGFAAQCNVVNHTPSCSCPAGYTGDPFTSCRRLPPTPPPAPPSMLSPSISRFSFCPNTVRPYVLLQHPIIHVIPRLVASMRCAAMVSAPAWPNIKAILTSAVAPNVY